MGYFFTKKGVKMAIIKDLESNRQTQRALAEIIKTEIDHETGEVLTTSNSVVTREKSRPKFIQLYVENLNVVWNLSAKAKSALIVLLNNLDYDNKIRIDANQKKIMQVYLDISRYTVANAIKELEEAKLIMAINTKALKEKYSKEFGMPLVGRDWYLINPNVVGKGSFNEIKRLRRTVKQDFDFVDFKAETQVLTSTEYSGIEAYQNVNEFNIVEDNIIEDKENNRIDRVTIIENKPKKNPVMPKALEDDYDEEVTKKKDFNLNQIKDIEVKDIKEEKTSQIEESNLTNEKMDYKLMQSINMKEIDLKLIEAKNKQLELENKQLELKIKLAGID